MKYITRTMIVTVLLLAAGCATSGPLPRGAKPVGGGFSIEWEAPVDGTAILVEKTTGAIVGTETLSSGDSFDFDIDSNSDLLEVLFAGHTETPPKPRFILYFIRSRDAD